MATRWRGNASDYARSSSLGEILQRKVLTQHAEPTWSEDCSRLHFLRDLPDGSNEIILVDTSTGEHLINNLELKTMLMLHLEKFSISLPCIRFQCVTLSAEQNQVVHFRLVSDSKLPLFEVNLLNYCIKGIDTPFASDESAESCLVSDPAGHEVHLEFVNRCQFTLHLYWVDDSGRDHKYKEIVPNATESQHTYSGHLWRFRHGLNQKTIAWYRANPSPERVVVLGVDTIETSLFIPPDVNLPSNLAPVEGDIKYNVVHDGIQLTTDGQKGACYSDITLSPNGEYIACFKVVEPPFTNKLTLIEHAPKDSIRPIVQTHTYEKPGDDMATYIPHVIHIATKTITPIDPIICQKAYSIANLTWHPSSEWFSFLYNPRGHKFLRLLGVHISGDTRVIVEETSSTFVFHTKHYMRHLTATGELLWTSERTGYRHLYLYFLPAHFHELEKLVGFNLTRGEYTVRKVLDVDEAKREILFALSGHNSNEDPYHLHYARLHMDKDGITQLTQADGFHDQPELSPNGQFYLDRYSRVDLPPTMELRRTIDGSLIAVLHQADVTELLKTGWSFPKRCAFPGRDGRTLIYGIAVFPLHYDQSTPLCVIENIYAGPHGAHVPKTFGLHLEMQKLAELGFVVVQIDGMGTAHRSKDFHDMCYQNIIDSGFPDRKLWIESLAKEIPLNLARGVGVYGGSAGGQNAVAGLLTHTDFYKVAVADCGCHDNRVDKLWWNELWMGYLDEDSMEAYVANSNATHVGEMMADQHLLLLVGLLDNNVDPACTFQLTQALIDADKDFDLICFPKLGHGAGGSAYGTRKRHDYFVRHLLKNEPRIAP